jgi:hypothetical protein
MFEEVRPDELKKMSLDEVEKMSLDEDEKISLDKVEKMSLDDANFFYFFFNFVRENFLNFPPKSYETLGSSEAVESI